MPDAHNVIKLNEFNPMIKNLPHVLPTCSMGMTYTEGDRFKIDIT